MGRKSKEESVIQLSTEEKENFKRLESFLDGPVKADHDERRWWAEPTLRKMMR